MGQRDRTGHGRRCGLQLGEGFTRGEERSGIDSWLKRLQAVAYMGAENIVDMDLRMGAEDFAYYTHVMPGCFFRLGTGNPDKPGTTSGLHRAEFDIDEDALATGAGMMAWGAISELER